MTRQKRATRAASAVLCAAILCGSGGLLPAQGRWEATRSGIGPAGVTPPPSHVRIGTWNLEQLGGRQTRRTGEDFQKIAALILQMGVAVLAVQEVGGPEPLGRLVAELNAQAAAAPDALPPTPVPPFQFVLGTTGGFGDGAGRISVGFLWDDRRVELTQAEELSQLPREQDGLPIFHRVPVSAVFRVRDGGLDFRAITVHLKASRGTVNEHKRRAEVQNLLAYVRELYGRRGEDRDIVVLGDFNHTYGSPAYDAFTEGELVRYLHTDGDPPTIVHFEEPIDQFAITAGGLDEEVVPESRKVHDDLLRELGKEAWRATYSDHLPVTLDLASVTDGDPYARFTPADPRQALLPGGLAMADFGAPAAAPAALPSAPKAAFPVGCRVTVTYRRSDSDSAQQQKGELCEPLGDWVVIDTGDAGVVAFPAMRIESVHRR